MIQLISTDTRLANASHLYCSVRGKAMAAPAPRSSNMFTTEFSVPAKLDRWCPGTSVCVNCWVVRSKTHTPSRENARNENKTTLQPALGGTFSWIILRITANRFSASSCCAEIAHKARTTGTFVVCKYWYVRHQYNRMGLGTYGIYHLPSHTPEPKPLQSYHGLDIPVSLLITSDQANP